MGVVGRSRAAYDCYPPEWSHGGPAPNLASFADEVHRQGWAENIDLFVFGSRGGQVVLPSLWQHLGNRMPPAVVINGGCAMHLPRLVHWPDAAVTFLLIGGQDNFRGNLTTEEYIAETRRRVSPCNGTTAILYIAKMQHIPQASLLKAVLPLMLCALQAWKANGMPPKDEFQQIVAALSAGSWHGRLMFTEGRGKWAPDVHVDPFSMARHLANEEDTFEQAASREVAAPIEMSRRQELGLMFRAAAEKAKPRGGASIASSGDKLFAAAQAVRKLRSRLDHMEAACATYRVNERALRDTQDRMHLGHPGVVMAY